MRDEYQKSFCSLIEFLTFSTWLSQPGEVGTAVKTALNAGYKHIDCARAYCNEAEVGQAFTEYFASPGAAKREDIYIVTKLWVKEFNIVKEACQRQLKDLQLEYLDLYLMHLPFEVDANIEGVCPENGVGLIGYNPERIAVRLFFTVISIREN